jgi:hypothetical protein
MVKGVSRRVIVVKTPDPKLFEEAIFIVKEDALKTGGVTQEDILKEAQYTADSYVRACDRKGAKMLPPPAWSAVGAAAVGLIWIISTLI